MVTALLSLFCVALLLNKRSPTTDSHVFDPAYLKIRCPLCRWEPQKHDRWLCDPGCQHHWNTFETVGVCPSCRKEWDQTVCLRCLIWSRHESWYETDHS